MSFFSKVTTVIVTYALLLTSYVPMVQAQEESGDTVNYDINQLALPSEVKSVSKQGGAIYYSPSVKGKVLIPIHFWGQIGKAGLHFMPVDTTLINGISMAGGPAGTAAMDGISLTRYKGDSYDHFKFDLTKGGDKKLHDFKLRPGDTVFIERDDFQQNRSYYTSLVGIAATFLSTILLYRTVKRDPGR